MKEPVTPVPRGSAKDESKRAKVIAPRVVPGGVFLTPQTTVDLIVDSVPAEE